MKKIVVLVIVVLAVQALVTNAFSFTNGSDLTGESVWESQNNTLVNSPSLIALSAVGMPEPTTVSLLAVGGLVTSLYRRRGGVVLSSKMS